MSDTNLADTANQILINLIKAVTDAKEFAAQQLPDVVHQLLVYKLWYSGILLFGGIFLLVGAALWTRYIGKKATASGYFDDDYTPIVLLLVSGGFAGFFMIFSNLRDFLELLLAPKVWLLEYAAQLVHG